MFDNGTWASVRERIAIRAPIDVVFAYVCDPSNHLDWMPKIGCSTKLSSGPIGATTRFSQVATFLGVSINGIWEITEYKPSERVSGTSISGPFNFQVAYDFRLLEDGTEVENHAEVSLSGVLGFVPKSLAETTLKREFQSALSRLKMRMELLYGQRG
jgi:uncharacterized membrane protein